MTLWSEIMSQPAALAASMAELHDPVAETAAWMKGAGITHAVLAARGTSDNAARYAQYVWGARNRLNVSLTTPSLFSVYGRPPDLAGALVVGISQSGESPDLLAVLAEAKRQGRPTLAITNSSSSPMARLADRALNLGVGEEAAVAATKSYTGQLLCIALLSAAMAQDLEQVKGELDEIPSVTEAVLASEKEIGVNAVDFVGHDRCVVIGRGFHHATAHEWALKIAELSYLVAQPFSSADFRHGPMALVERGLGVLAVATQSPLFPELSELLAEISAAGSHVVAISDAADCPANQVIRVPAVAEWLSPIPAIVAAQVFTYHLTVARGQNPDRPRALRKVTRTV
jgi:glucosamine--fructose-6-phosphate aminotransferase (isomerizing)